MAQTHCSKCLANWRLAIFSITRSCSRQVDRLLEINAALVRLSFATACHLRNHHPVSSILSTGSSSLPHTTAAQLRQVARYTPRSERPVTPDRRRRNIRTKRPHPDQHNTKTRLSPLASSPCAKRLTSQARARQARRHCTTRLCPARPRCRTNTAAAARAHRAHHCTTRCSARLRDSPSKAASHREQARASRQQHSVLLALAACGRLRNTERSGAPRWRAACSSRAATAACPPGRPTTSNGPCTLREAHQNRASSSSPPEAGSRTRRPSDRGSAICCSWEIKSIGSGRVPCGNLPSRNALVQLAANNARSGVAAASRGNVTTTPGPAAISRAKRRHRTTKVLSVSLSRHHRTKAHATQAFANRRAFAKPQYRLQSTWSS
mmetsp:Transcript_106709/g.244339  ORF Transcript_106709/g.244339 Transcript_106709/m.244339 type:complete len:379 (-) Transcript_106709:1020-2156(-)